MTDAKKYAARVAITVAVGAVVGVVCFFVSDPGHAGTAAAVGTVTLNLDCVREHLGSADSEAGKLEMLNQCETAINPGKTLAKSFSMAPVAAQRLGAHRNPVPVAMTAEQDHSTMNLGANLPKIPVAQQEKDLSEIRSQVLGSERANGLGANNYAATLRSQVESNPLIQQALELTRRVLEPERPDSFKAFSNVPASMEKAVVALTRQVFSPELKQTMDALNKFAAKLGGVGRGAAAELSKMNVNDVKRHLFASTVAVAASLSPSAALAAENVANIATRADAGTMGAYLATVLGLSIPVVFLVTLFIQSDAQGTATTFRQPDSIGGMRFEDE
jgi:photosystem II PsbM protein